MSQVMMTPDVITITEVVGDMNVVCDYAERDWCRKAPAKWIGFLSPCACGAGGQRLICEPCKQILLEADSSCFQCDCGEITAPARLAFSRLERLFT